MRDIWVVSDWHFNHTNILNFMDKNGNKFRGDLFNSAGEMNEIMIQNHNSLVKDGDIVYHLGDCYFGPQKEANEILHRLKGSKRLILGNHDDAKDSVLHQNFQKILVWRVFKEFDCVLTHVPLHETSINEKVSVNVHGHIHQNKSPTNYHINACVEWLDYKPVLLGDMISEHKKKYPEVFNGKKWTYPN